MAFSRSNLGSTTQVMIGDTASAVPTAQSPLEEPRDECCNDQDVSRHFRTLPRHIWILTRHAVWRQVEQLAYSEKTRLPLL